MILGLVALVIASADTTSRFAISASDSLPIGETIAAANLPLGLAPPQAALESSSRPLRPSAKLEPWGAIALPADTLPRPRRPLVQYSEWYGRRVTIHKALSWTMLPLFAVSYVTGDQLLEKGRARVSSTVRTLHPLAAGGAAAVFGVNTVTGLWNLWDARKDPNGRTRRIVHSVLFLAADAGFAYAGSLGEEAGRNRRTRDRHRSIALGSMGVSTAGWLIMLIGNR
jgi:hypothetical protein